MKLILIKNLSSIFHLFLLYLNLVYSCIKIRLKRVSLLLLLLLLLIHIVNHLFLTLIRILKLMNLNNESISFFFKYLILILYLVNPKSNILYHFKIEIITLFILCYLKFSFLNKLIFFFNRRICYKLPST
jgi:hypothetical protein